MSAFYTFLKGSWDLKRTIANHLTKQIGKLEGKATFNATADSSTLFYKESGFLILGEYADRSEQQYIYQFTSDQEGQVFFANRQFFHAFNKINSSCSITHTCGNDTYKGLYAWTSPTSYSLTWLVQGPRKNYKMISILER